MTELVHYEVDRAIATITLDSPAQPQRAVRAAGRRAGRRGSRTAAADDAVRAVVLTHTGTMFCAGADLNEQSAEGGPEQGTGGMLALLRQIVELPKPVVARLDGHVRAGGIGMRRRLRHRGRRARTRRSRSPRCGSGSRRRSSR